MSLSALSRGPFPPQRQHRGKGAKRHSSRRWAGVHARLNANIDGRSTCV